MKSHLVDLTLSLGLGPVLTQDGTCLPDQLCRAWHPFPLDSGTVSLVLEQLCRLLLSRPRDSMDVVPSDVLFNILQRCLAGTRSKLLIWLHLSLVFKCGSPVLFLLPWLSLSYAHRVQPSACGMLLP